MSRREPSYTTIDRCRICGNDELVPILDLGSQVLTGHFPRPTDPPVPAGPLELVKCHGDDPADHCGLLQLRHAFDPGSMYGQNYGYRSSLNRSMVEHLRDINDDLQRRVELRPGDLVIDIGSNDGTFLSFYPADAGLDLVGIDPTGEKFRRYYRDHVRLIADFFSGDVVRRELGFRKARIVTSIAMFYDLPSPLQFMRDIAAVLAPDGLWRFEQSYMPLMLENNSYDTVCHEHLEYYGLRQIVWMADRAGLKVIDVSFNDANGGSFAVTAALVDSPHQPDSAIIDGILARERAEGLNTLEPYRAFERRVAEHPDQLCDLLRRLKADGRRVLGYGASTKGNVVLQYCRITSDLVPAIVEVNPDKFGCETPGTGIPIIGEAEAAAMRPDYFLVLPWHFRAGILRREKPFIDAGGRFIFPLPRVEVVPE